MIILKHIKFKIKDSSELERLLGHIRETALKVGGIEFKDDKWFCRRKNGTKRKS